MPLFRDFARQQVVIANGGTTSGAADVSPHGFLGIVIPAAFTGTLISFQVSDLAGGTYQALYDDTGTLVTLTVAQGRSYTLPVAVSAWPFIKIVSNGAEAAARTLIIITKG